ncbi:hypothetical protein Glove_231g10 [Diversispora epigaea]|uniref:Uncharacterized protein n=1 Tax=Diversispora epigaea TaxID=1348612 RepID=A0A397IK61_9GLOM|nr:hypothetical protein Glove_231g10 [Diversispora epigaea]
MPRNTKKPKKNNNNDNEEAPEATVTLSSMPVSTIKSASVSALLSKSASRFIVTTKSTSTSKLKSNSTSTKSTCSTSTLTALIPIASTQFASSLIPTRRFQESFSLDVETNKKKKTNKFEDKKTNQKIINTLLEIKKDIIGIKKKSLKYTKKIAQTVLKPFIETNMYPDIEKLKEETKNYLNSNDPKFSAKYAIETSINERYNGLEGKKEVRKAFEKLHEKINNDNNKEIPTWCNKILQRAFPNPASGNFSGLIEIFLDPDNGSIKVKDEIMKSKIRKNIDKIENGNIYISSSSSESFSESEKDNNDNTNEDNKDVGVIYIDSNEENDINLFQMDDESEME